MEILKAVKYCKDQGINVYGFTKDETTPLANLLTDPIYNACGDCEHSYLLYYFVMLRILKNRGEFPHYDRWADQMENLFKDLLAVRENLSQERSRSQRHMHMNHIQCLQAPVSFGVRPISLQCVS